MRIARLVLLLLIPASAWAQSPGDDLDRLLAARGLADARAGSAPTPAATGTLPAAAPAGSATANQTASGVANSSPSLRDRASDLVVSAMGALGVPYRRGGNSFESGFDCSGFVRAVYEQTLGLLLPRRASEQAAATQPIGRNDLKPGDLVFFNTMRRAFSHVGIYVGDSKFIHSPKPGAAVRIEDMRMAYWSRRFDGARRVEGAAPEPESAPAQAQITSALAPSLLRQ